MAARSRDSVGTNGHPETCGPRVGVQLTKDQAQKLFDLHLPGLKCISIRYIDRGYNNRTYVVGADDGSEVIIRLGGRFWNRSKTENEIACLVYARRHCPKVPVPQVLFYASNRDLIGAEYIGMQLLPGRPLDEAWPEMGEEGRMRAVGRLAEIFCEIRKVKFDQIGNLGFRKVTGSEVPEAEDVFVDRCFELEAGPFDTFRDLAKAQLEDALKHFLKHPFFRPLRHLEGRLKRFSEDFLSQCTGSTGSDMWGAVHGRTDIVLSHGDFEPRNVLVDEEGEVTGILDWEFSGAFPAEEEWFTGLEFLGANTAEVTEEEYAPSGDAGGAGVLARVEEMGRYRKFFEECLDRLGEPVLPLVDRERHLRRTDVWVLQANIAPWYLQDIEDDVPEEAYEQRDRAARIVDKILQKYGG